MPNQHQAPERCGGSGRIETGKEGDGEGWPEAIWVALEDGRVSEVTWAGGVAPGSRRYVPASTQPQPSVLEELAEEFERRVGICTGALERELERDSRADARIVAARRGEVGALNAAISIVRNRATSLSASQPQPGEGDEGKPPIWEVWRSLWSIMGALDAICDELPEGPTGGRLRAELEHGIPEILPFAERALRDAGVEPDQAVSDKSFARGFQVMVLLRREEESGERDSEAWKQPPDEFLAAYRENPDQPQSTRAPLNEEEREKLRAAARLLRQITEGPDPYSDDLIAFLRSIADQGDICPQCHGHRVTEYAGDLQRDDGYCELRRCSTCSTGERIGRSDRPIVTESAPSLSLVADHQREGEGR